MDDFKQINDVSPSSLNHLVGQTGIIAQVRTAIDAAFEDKTPFPDAMLVGGPGLGKSQIGHVISQEMATEFNLVLGQSLTGIGDLNQFLLSASHNSVCLIDEAHELDKQFQTALYLAIDKRTIFANSSKRSPEAIPIADFTLLLPPQMNTNFWLRFGTA